MTVLTMAGWEINSGSLLRNTALIGFAGENLTEDLYIIPDVMYSYTYMLDCKNGSAVVVIPLSKTSFNGTPALHALLTEDQIGSSGTVSLQVIASRADGDDTYIKKSNIFRAVIGDSINATALVSQTSVDILNNYLAKVGASADAADDAVKNINANADVYAKEYLNSVKKEISDWEDEQKESFNTWYSQMQSTLDGDVATNLQTQITANKESIAALTVEPDYDNNNLFIHIPVKTAE